MDDQDQIRKMQEQMREMQEQIKALQKHIKAADERVNITEAKAEERVNAAEARAEERVNIAEVRQRQAEQRMMKQTLVEFLRSCHEVAVAVEVITDPSRTTKGDTTNPTARIYPKKIIPCPEFDAEQAQIWRLLAASQSFGTDNHFRPLEHLHYTQSQLKPVSSELDVRLSQFQCVENFVIDLTTTALADETLRRQLGVDGSVEIKNHTNEAESTTAESSADGSRTKRRKVSSGRLRKVGTADNFFYHIKSVDYRRLALAVEYKAPHKLTVDYLVTGLRSEICPDLHVINQDGDDEDFAFASRRLAAAVVTQLFSYMVNAKLRYGYICTGEAFVFLRIPADDPTVVYYSLCVPQHDVKADAELADAELADAELADAELGLHRTAAAQVFAFLLQALRDSKSPDQSWSDKAAKLETWAVEYDDILRKIPPSVRKEKKPSTPYKPSNWKGLIRKSPIMTRSVCQPSDSGYPAIDDEDGDSDGDNSLSRSPTLANSMRKMAGNSEKGGVENAANQKTGKGKTIRNIQQRPYCTQKCLLGLARGGSLDQACPNIQHHKNKHLPRQDFLQLIREQLAIDRGADADSMPLHLAGAIGGLVKIRLSSHGYTLIAKGTKASKAYRLHHESHAYSQAADLQGKDLPVCLGTIELDLPYYVPHTEYNCFLFLSWAGVPLQQLIKGAQNQQDGIDKISLLNDVEATFHRLHNAGILHRDVALRNLLYDADRKKLVIVDLERAEVRTKEVRTELQDQAPAKLSPILGLKRKFLAAAALCQSSCDDAFASERKKARSEVYRWVK